MKNKKRLDLSIVILFHLLKLIDYRIPRISFEIVAYIFVFSPDNISRNSCILKQEIALKARCDWLISNSEYSFLIYNHSSSKMLTSFWGWCKLEYQLMSSRSSP